MGHVQVVDALFTHSVWIKSAMSQISRWESTTTIDSQTTSYMDNAGDTDPQSTRRSTRSARQPLSPPLQPVSRSRARLRNASADPTPMENQTPSPAGDSAPTDDMDTRRNSGDERQQVTTTDSVGPLSAERSVDQSVTERPHTPPAGGGHPTGM